MQFRLFLKDKEHMDKLGEVSFKYNPQKDCKIRMKFAQAQQN
jgi:hypothetical protein